MARFASGSAAFAAPPMTWTRPVVTGSGSVSGLMVRGEKTGERRTFPVTLSFCNGPGRAMARPGPRRSVRADRAGLRRLARLARGLDAAVGRVRTVAAEAGVIVAVARLVAFAVIGPLAGIVADPGGDQRAVERV